MANLISVGGDWTTAASWGTVESVSELDSEGVSTTIGTSNVDSSTFVPAAVAIDGVALKLAGRAYVLENGRVTLSGTGDSLLADDRVRSAYLGL